MPADEMSAREINLASVPRPGGQEVNNLPTTPYAAAYMSLGCTILESACGAVYAKSYGFCFGSELVECLRSLSDVHDISTCCKASDQGSVNPRRHGKQLMRTGMRFVSSAWPNAFEGCPDEGAVIWTGI